MLGGAEGASGAHWLWLSLETTIAKERGMSPGREKRDVGPKGGGGKSPAKEKGKEFSVLFA